MLTTLNELTAKYLKENGISIRFFAEYIGEEYTLVSKWLKGKKNIKTEKIVMVHKFLKESYVPANEILKERKSAINHSEN